MGDGVDAARNALRRLKDRLDGRGLEELKLGARESKEMLEVIGRLSRDEGTELVSDDDPLRERLVHCHREPASKLRLAAEK